MSNEYAKKTSADPENPCKDPPNVDGTRRRQELAQGMEIRAGLNEQLERFFDLLVQSVSSGDTAWMDPILLDWAKSSTETDLQEGLYQVTFIINRMNGLRNSTEWKRSR